MTYQAIFKVGSVRRSDKSKLNLWEKVCWGWMVIVIVAFGFIPVAILWVTPIGWYWPLLIAMTALSIASAWEVWKEEPRILVAGCVLFFAAVLASVTRDNVEYRETPQGHYLKIESDKWRGKKKVRFVSEQEYIDATTPEYEGRPDPRQ